MMLKGKIFWSSRANYVRSREQTGMREIIFKLQLHPFPAQAICLMITFVECCQHRRIESAIFRNTSVDYGQCSTLAPTVPSFLTRQGHIVRSVGTDGTWVHGGDDE